LNTIDLKSKLRYLTKTLVTRDFEQARNLIESLAKSYNGDCPDILVQYAKRNGIAHIFYEVLQERGLANTKLAKALAIDADLIYRRRKDRDELLLNLVEVLEENGFDYVIFKTFNDLGIVDVDIDFLICPEEYWNVVNTFLRDGFKPIDDLKKTYATGFMYGKNPIILDLHTEVTVLGAPYIDTEKLLKHKVRIKYKTESGESINLYVLDTAAEALARVSHAIIKEAEIKIEDISEVLKASEKCPIKLEKLIEEENLTPSLQIFTTKVKNELGLSFHGINSSRSTLASRALQNIAHGEEGLPPYHLSRFVSIATLFYRMQKRKQVKLVLKMMSSIKYRRNAAHIGGIIVKRLLEHYE
jgi:hypothetical protein